jgi:hypothetical protein
MVEIAIVGDSLIQKGIWYFEQILSRYMIVQTHLSKKDTWHMREYLQAMVRNKI